MSRPVGFKHTEKTRIKIGLAMSKRLSEIRLEKLADKNPMWRGDSVRCGALHEWVRARRQKPILCEICGEEPPFDLASISHEYKRDLNDWQWLCRRCHMVKDGRMNNLIQFARQRTTINE